MGCFPIYDRDQFFDRLAVAWSDRAMRERLSGCRRLLSAVIVAVSVGAAVTVVQGTAIADEECTPSVHNPHASSHVPGTANVVADLTCRSSKPHISGTVNIQREVNPGYWAVLNDGFGGRDNTRSLSVNAAADECVNGARYRAFALFSYTTDGVNTINVQGASPEVTMARCP